MEPGLRRPTYEGEVGRAARDRVEVGEVQVAEPEDVAKREREGERVVACREHAADDLVRGASAPSGVDGFPTQEVDDGDDANGQRLAIRGSAMRVLVHEWVTGGGLAGPLPASWAAEGRAMRRAIADDFHHVEGVDVVMTLDERFSEPGLPWTTLAVAPGRDEDVLRRLAATFDYTVLIAPETDGVLEARAVLIEKSGGRPLGSTQAAIALTTDKQKLADHLLRAESRRPSRALSARATACRAISRSPPS